MRAIRTYKIQLGGRREIVFQAGKFALILGFRREDRVEPEYVRICDRCCVRTAIVWCRSHAYYLCDQCIGSHNKPFECGYVSTAVARVWNVGTELSAVGQKPTRETCLLPGSQDSRR